jgi:hypothetical protein
LVKLRLAQGPVPPSGEGSASFEGWAPLRVGFRLARGLDAPSSEVPSRSRAERPLERISVSLEGITGPPPPYLLPRPGNLMHWHLQAPGSKMNPCHDTPGDHAPALLRQLPRRGDPRHCATLCGVASNYPMALCRPLSYGRRAAPSKKDDRSLKGETNDYSTPAQDYAVTSGQWGVTSVAIGPVRPSPPLHHHPRRCGSVRRQDATTPATVPRTASRQRHPRVLTWADTEQATSTSPPLKPPLDAHRMRHDAPLEARFIRTAVYSVALYAIPPHVDKTVRHDVNCLLLGL